MKWGRIFGGLAVAALVWTGVSAAGQPEKIALTAAITALVALWWMTEALPLPATSLIPFAAFPLAGILTEREAAAALGNYVIVLLMASFMLSKSLEKSGAHERLALYMINLVGGSGRRLVFGFMIAGALISMWVSNTATALMLTPIALAILARSECRGLDAPVLLAVAYSASIGGVGTLIGTPPNMIFAGVYENLTGSEYGFLEWMKTGIPVAIIAAPVAALWLARRIKPGEKIVLPDPGRWKTPEIRTLMVFGAAILLWVTRTEPFGGWAGLTGIGAAGDSTVALTAVIAMFLIPDGRKDADGKPGTLLDWKTAGEIPWGIVLLFAGGICIASAFEASGLSALIGSGLAGAGELPLFPFLLALCLGVTFMSELASNTAIATLMLPILAAGAGGTGLAPETLMVPAAIAASSGFMLPVSTPPNSIVYATGRVSIAEMAREGFALNIIVAVIIAAVSWATLG